jgi:hypothetical protein
MAPLRDALRYPAKRVLLQRTRLAYVHLRNLLTDAKRDRAARIYGYVAVWLPDELIVIFLEEGEVVNATCTTDGVAFVPIAISEAIAHVPASAEYGSICFHEATDEQLDTMFETQVGKPIPWPRELAPTDPDALLAYLYATMHDGIVELRIDGCVHYIAVASGQPVRGYFSDARPGEVIGHLHALLEPGTSAAPPVVRLWPRAEALPAQASPALITAYRELMAALAARLKVAGVSAAADVMEGARRSLVQKHALLDRFSPAHPTTKDPVTDTAGLTAALSAWFADVMWAAARDDLPPEQLIRELTAHRRHMFQAAGLYDALPWKVHW